MAAVIKIKLDNGSILFDDSSFNMTLVHSGSQLLPVAGGDNMLGAELKITLPATLTHPVLATRSDGRVVVKRSYRVAGTNQWEWVLSAHGFPTSGTQTRVDWYVFDKALAADIPGGNTKCTFKNASGAIVWHLGMLPLRVKDFKTFAAGNWAAPQTFTYTAGRKYAVIQGTHIGYKAVSYIKIGIDPFGQDYIRTSIYNSTSSRLASNGVALGTATWAEEITNFTSPFFPPSEEYDYGPGYVLIVDVTDYGGVL